MSTTYSVTGLGPTAASTWRVSSFFKKYWGAFQERRKRQRLLTNLCDLSDWELKALRGERSTTSLQTEVAIREASEPPDKQL